MKKLIPLLLLLTIITSCNNDEHKNYPMGIEGTWRLEKIVNGFSGYAQVYNTGDVTWTFNEDNGTIVINNNAPDNVYSILAAGSYAYSNQLETGVCENYITLYNNNDTIPMGCAAATARSLTINNGFADGDTYIFKR